MADTPLKLYAVSALATKTFPGGPITLKQYAYTFYSSADAPMEGLQEEMRKIVRQGNCLDESWLIDIALCEAPADHIRRVYESMVDWVEGTINNRPTIVDQSDLETHNRFE